MPAPSMPSSLIRLFSFPGADWPSSASWVCWRLEWSRRQTGATGHLFWSARPLLQNREGIADLLTRELYPQPALPPAFTWLGATAPTRPTLTIGTRFAAGGLKLSWAPADAKPAWLWVLQTKTDGQWRTQILPGRQSAQTLARPARPEAIALSAVDRCGNASPPTVLEIER